MEIKNNMKVIFKTFSPNAPASIFYYDAFKKSRYFEIDIDDKYESADYVFFMTYKEDLEELKKIKTKFPTLKTAIIDPRGDMVDNYVKYCDFFIVDSIEMRDYFSKYQLPIYTYYEYPCFESELKNHNKKDKIIIGYHGNKVHLTAMFPKITSALEILSNEYKIEFWPIYDFKGLGYWNIGTPKNLKIKHIQWYPDVYINEMLDMDIGLAPACMPIKNTSKVSRFFLDSDEDYTIKFKMPSNPGRLAVFAQLGIPVVADFLPSHIQFIDHGESGFLAESTGAWYQSLKSLIVSHKLRKKISLNMRNTYLNNFEFDNQNKKFYIWLQEFSIDKKSYLNLDLNQKDHRGSFIENIKFNNAYFYDTIFKLSRKLNKFFKKK